MNFSNLVLLWFWQQWSSGHFHLIIDQSFWMIRPSPDQTRPDQASWVAAAAGGSLVLLGNVRDCETIESIPVPHLHKLQLHPQSIIISSLKEFFITKEQISDHMRSLCWVFNLLAKAANTRMEAKPKNTFEETKLNWTAMQCNDCFVSAPIATDHFMCSFLYRPCLWLMMQG